MEKQNLQSPKKSGDVEKPTQGSSGKKKKDKG